MRAADLPEAVKGHLVEADPESEEEIQRYNTFAANHAHIIAKSLLSAGTTWPGVFTSEDQRAVVDGPVHAAPHTPWICHCMRPAGARLCSKHLLVEYTCVLLQFGRSCLAHASVQAQHRKRSESHGKKQPFRAFLHTRTDYTHGMQQRITLFPSGRLPG